MKQLSGTDTLFLAMETPTWHQHIGGLTVLDPTDAPGFGFERVVERLADRLPLAPKFMWKLKEVPLGLDRPVWIDDDDFDIERHVRRARVAAPGGKHESAELLGQILSEQLDRQIPLWEYWFVEGLSRGRAAMVLKFHHCLLDGVAGASLTNVLFDIAPEAPPPPIPDVLESAGPEPSTSEMLRNAARPEKRLPVTITRYAAQLLRRGITLANHRLTSDRPPPVDSAPRVRWNHKVGPRRSCAFTSVSLRDVKTVTTSSDVKVNDVVLAICSGAIRSYLVARDELPESSLVASVPISTRGPDDTALDNKLSNMFVTLGTDVADPVARLAAVAESSRASKDLSEAVRSKSIRSLGETAPPWVLGQAVKTMYATGLASVLPTMVNTVISSVAGPPVPLYFAGARATGMFSGSLIVESMGLNFTALSYDDRVDIGLVADPDLVPDLWDLADAVPGSLAALLSAAGLGDPTPIEDPWGGIS